MATRHPKLTKRELEVLEQIACNATNKEIAAYFFISSETVKSHVTHVLRKLGCRSRLQAAIKGVRLGLVELSDAQPSGISR
jgi:DNA-binding CsgD family transcriptional regulator